MTSLSVGGRLILTEIDRKGGGKVDKIVINLEGVPFITITDSQFSGRFDKIEQIDEAK